MNKKFSSGNLLTWAHRSTNLYGCRIWDFSLFFLMGSLLNLGMALANKAVFSLAMVGFYVPGILLVVGLLFIDKWPSGAMHFFPLYWYFTITYCLAFCAILACLLLLQETAPCFHLVGILQLVISTLVLARFVNGAIFLGLTLAGALGALVLSLFLLSSPISTLTQPTIVKGYRYPILLLALGSYIVSLLMGKLIFCKNKQPSIKDEYKLSLLGKELLYYARNKFGLGKSYASVLQMCIKEHGNITMKKEGPSNKVVFEMDSMAYDYWQSILTLLEKAHQRLQLIMRFRVDSVTPKMRLHILNNCDAIGTIKKAFLMYANINDFPYALPQLDTSNNFVFQGSERRFINLMVNLLGFSYTHQEARCERKIWIEGSTIHYRYKGKGIPNRALLKLFSYSAKPLSKKANIHIGGGVGNLYYVGKIMRAFGGQVSCRTSTAPNNSYTWFSLTFPKLKEDNNKEKNSNEEVDKVDKE